MDRWMIKTKEQEAREEREVGRLKEGARVIKRGTQKVVIRSTYETDHTAVEVVE